MNKEKPNDLLANYGILVGTILLVTLFFGVNYCNNKYYVKKETKADERGIHQRYSDYQIKKLAYDVNLTNQQVNILLYRPLMNKIKMYDTAFSCSIHDIRIAMTSIIILETNRLKSKSVYINNLFGIKTFSGRPQFLMKTLEFENGKMIVKEERFVAFFSIEDGMDAFLKKITNEKRYRKTLEAIDCDSFLKELHNAGYATDPLYYEKVSKIAQDIEN